MVFTPYKLSLPTTVEPTKGFRANDRVVFKMPIERGTQTRERSVRLNGILQLLQLNGLNQEVPVVASNKLFLSPLVGVSGCMRQLTSYGRAQSGEVQLENIFEYGRWVAMKNEASHNSYWATSGDSMLEVMNYENFNYQDGTAPDVKMAGCNLLFPPDAPYVNPEDELIQQAEMPFSLDLDICLNSANIPSSKFQELSISIVLQDVAKSGLVSRSGTPTTFIYALKNLEVRYICDPETVKGPVVLEIKDNSFNGTVLNKISALEHSPSCNFHSIACSFLKQGHDNATNNLVYDYLAREVITEGVDYFELKINGSSQMAPLKYPLRFRQTEHAMNYIMSLNNGSWSENALSYPKMTADGTIVGSVKNGYGLGAHLFQEMPNNTRVQFNLALLSAPSDNYRAFFYVIGSLQI
jgi:hypothetical protein